MATEKFPSELASRGTVKTTDKLIIHNIDTGATEYCTVTELLAALAIFGNVGIGTTGAVGWKLTVFENRNDDVAAYIKNTNASGYGIKLQGGAEAKYSLLVSDYGDNTLFQVLGNGRVIAGMIPAYNDNANAAASGLAAGTFYRTGDALKIVHA